MVKALTEELPNLKQQIQKILKEYEGSSGYNDIMKAIDKLAKKLEEKIKEYEKRFVELKTNSENVGVRMAFMGKIEAYEEVLESLRKP